MKMPRRQHYSVSSSQLYKLVGFSGAEGEGLLYQDAFSCLDERLMLFRNGSSLACIRELLRGPGLRGGSDNLFCNPMVQPSCDTVPARRENCQQSNADSPS